MVYKHLDALGFHCWIDMADEDYLLNQLPESIGVFVVRRANSSDSSHDLVHVGVGANSKGLKNRVRQIYHPGSTQSTNQNINNRLVLGQRLQLSFIQCRTKEIAESVKKDIKQLSC